MNFQKPGKNSEKLEEISLKPMATLLIYSQLFKTFFLFNNKVLYLKYRKDAATSGSGNLNY